MLAVAMENAPLRRPLLIYDGQCALCRRWIARWKLVTRGAVDFEPSQTAAARFGSVPRTQFERSVVLVELDGRVRLGADAVFRSLALSGRTRLPAWLYQRVRPFRFFTEYAYAMVASHRDVFDQMDRRLFGRVDARERRKPPVALKRIGLVDDACRARSTK